MDENELAYHVEARLADEGPSTRTALAFWYFLGAIAAHNFYLGRRRAAITQLSFQWGGLALIFLGKFLGSSALAVVGFIATVIGGLSILFDLFRIPDLVTQRNDTLREIFARELRASPPPPNSRLPGGASAHTDVKPAQLGASTYRRQNYRWAWMRRGKRRTDQSTGG